jgi:hypothetical protein
MVVVLLGHPVVESLEENLTCERRRVEAVVLSAELTGMHAAHYSTVHMSFKSVSLFVYWNKNFVLCSQKCAENLQRPEFYVVFAEHVQGPEFYVILAENRRAFTGTRILCSACRDVKSIYWD